MKTIHRYGIDAPLRQTTRLGTMRQIHMLKDYMDGVPVDDLARRYGMPSRTSVYNTVNKTARRLGMDTQIRIRHKIGNKKPPTVVHP